MNTRTINFAANEQCLKLIGDPLKLADDTVNYIEAVFDLGENWGGFDSVSAIWFNDFVTIATVLDGNGKCFVPVEVMNRTGKVYVNLVGSIAENDELAARLTTAPILAVYNVANARVTGSETRPLTPSQFEQFVEAVKEAVAEIKDVDTVELNADYTLTFYFSDGTETTVGPIRGEQGPQGPAGPTGNGIDHISLTSTSGLVKTYTIYFTDGTTTTFTVTDGSVSAAQLKSILPTDTASGSIASFSDGSDLVPAQALSVSLEPIQDLNGYDKPWSAGAGEQLIPYPYSSTGSSTINGITFNVLDEGKISVVGTATANAQIDLCTSAYSTMLKLKAGKSYALSINNSSCMAVIVVYTAQGVWFLERTTTASTTFSLPNDGLDYRARILLRVINGTAISTPINIALKLQEGTTATAWTPYSNVCPISGRTEVETVVSPTTSAEDGDTYTTALGRTVYGGTLDVVSGELVVDRAIVDLGSLSWVFNASFNYFVGSNSGMATLPNWRTVSHIMSDRYETTYPDNVATASHADFVISTNPTGTQIVIADSRYTDAVSFKSAMNGITVCYELATPQTYQLTPTEVALLLGDNNVWADSGNVTVTYSADVQRYIEKVLN